MRKLIFIFLISFVVQSCGGKYKMTNVLPETVDVTAYIESGEFRPDSCDGRLDKIIRVKPRKLDRTYETALQIKLKEWLRNYNSWLIKNKKDTIDFSVPDLFEKTSYQYSYFIEEDPIDVYRTDTDIEIKGNKHFKFFIRFDKEMKMVDGYQEEGWVISCDSINSVQPFIH